jgi:hypothetical protein
MTVARPCVSLGGEHADRLVQHVDDARLGTGDRLAVERDGAPLVDVSRGVGDDLPGDGDPPCCDQRLGGAPRGDARVGEVLG